MTIDASRILPSHAALSLLPPKTARALGVLPVSLTGTQVTLCISDVTDYALRDKVEHLLPDYTLAFVEPTEPAALTAALKMNYPDAVLTGELTKPEKLLTHLLTRALAKQASDIHLDPTEEGARIRFRIDGRMRLERVETSETATEFTSYIKVLANLDISERRAPQDGNIDLPFDGKSISLRVATVPTVWGEHVTLRLLSRTGEVSPLERLDRLGMHENQFTCFKRALEMPNGVIVLSGPTGSGKTTTLYAALRHLAAADDLHLVSIEDPVEKPVAGVTQIKVDARQDRVGFGKALRSILRHDPDVVMIGEVRDGETAETAMRSALTGHLVLTTLHTNDAPGILTRLIDLGVPNYLVAGTLRLAVAQRLLRRPCAVCMTRRPATADECALCGWDPQQPPLIPQTCGCAYCANTGYSGRTAVYEMLPVTEEVRTLLLSGEGEGALRRHLTETAPELTLWGDALAKVLEGETTLEEVCSVVSKRD